MIGRTNAVKSGSAFDFTDATVDNANQILKDKVAFGAGGVKYTGTLEGTPPTSNGGGIFTGATIPLTYKDNTHANENTYVYKSQYNITIAGLTGVTITGNGTKEVTVLFDVTSAISSLAEFTITVNGVVYKGLHAHYGTTVTGILTLAYTNVPRSGTGTVGVEYLFIETADTALPRFTSTTTLWNGIYSYQLLNVLIGNYSLTSIGDRFLEGCYSFNQPLDISGVESIGYSFLEGCNSFNQPLDISGVESINAYFLYGCYSFNQPLDLSGVESISDYFLYGCYSFNQPLDLSGLTSISGYFLNYCYSFNQPLDLSGLTIIGYGFLNHCRSFNQPLDLSGVESIGMQFLYNCYSFNQPIIIPSGVTSILNDFMENCYSFNQPIIIPSTITSIGADFMLNCYSLSTITWNSSTFPTDNEALSQTINSKTNTTSGSGIIVYGTQRAGLLTALSNRTTSPYRKLINGGAD